jgi:hypothetical protein
MRYLSLDNSEFKELLNFKKVSFAVYLLLSTVLILISYIILDRILSDEIGISTLSIVLLLAVSSLAIFLYSNRGYLLDLIKKEKKVFKGVLSSKTIKGKNERTYYVFNMDGNSFIVDKDTFEKCEVGNIVEFHISSFTKYLFRVEKIGESA